jgi:hypothetical protein
MLKTVEISRAKKTKGIAVTYRAGTKNKYGTCPIDCKMNCSGTGTKSIDWEYFDALLDAVPSKGVSFTYSHFDWNLWAHKQRGGQTVINYSTENLVDAIVASQYVPTVVVVGNQQNTDWKNFEIKRSDIPEHTAKVVRCPAEYRDISCAQCGNGEPLCARLNRNFIVGFTAHGPSKRAAADPTIRGGCYADAGNCRIWWDQTANGEQEETDGEKLKRFVSGLPPRSIVRHHVAGDIGAE